MTPKHKSGGIFPLNVMLGISAPVWRDCADPQYCKADIKGACAQPDCWSAELRAWSGPSEQQSPALFSISGKSSCSSEPVLQPLLWMHFALSPISLEIFKISFTTCFGHFLHWSFVAMLRPMSEERWLTAPLPCRGQPRPLEYLHSQHPDSVSGPGFATHSSHDSGKATSISFS